jgi:hypothetical protein
MKKPGRNDTERMVTAMSKEATLVSTILTDRIGVPLA